jgi:hypothetical protein
MAGQDGKLDYRCDRFKDRVGYRGQKYEVRFTRDGEEHVMGWQNESEGGLAKAGKLMPGVTAVRIVEVKTEEKQ